MKSKIKTSLTWQDLAGGGVEMPDGKTITELSAIFSLGESAVRRKMRKLKEQGLVEQGWKHIHHSSGYCSRAMAYRIKQEAHC